MRAKILIVDPNVGQVASIQHVLETDGHKVKNVQTANAAKKSVEKEDFDVIFINAELKDISCIDLLRTVRQARPDIEIVLITNLANLKNSNKLNMFDIAGYLIPPIAEDKVRTLTQRALRQHELLKENRRLIEAITRAKKDWEATVDAIEDPLFIVNLENKILRANLAVFRLLKKGVNEVIGKKCYNLIHRTDSPPPDCIMGRVKDEAAPVLTEVECVGFGGRHFCSAYPQVFEGGFGVVHFLRDVKKSGSQDRYQLIFERSPLPILYIDCESQKIVDANVKATEFLKFKKEDLIDLKFKQLLTEKECEYVTMAMPKKFDNLAYEVNAFILDCDKVKLKVLMKFSIIELDNKRFLQVILIP